MRFRITILIMNVTLAFAAFAAEKIVMSPSEAVHKTPRAVDRTNDSRALATTAKIRRALVNDERLSAYARNITIITQAGRVTLAGDIANEGARQQVIDAAKNVVGSDRVSAKGLIVSAE